ncbi:radical SAM protein, partial [candidate division KSB3 bacterium]|nr:radical SAM protein [candidate division KSB3 bacterium]MBD3325441.1 radical SAM protein [candidate division KSB3 bacterium]
MPKTLYLINPAASFPFYYETGVYSQLGFQPATMMAHLALTTVAAMVPDDFAVQVCDERIFSADFDCTADIIGITGTYSQLRRIITLARAFRRQGRIVVIGGPLASLYPEAVRPHCDIVVRGELEQVAARLFSDLRKGTWQAEYIGEWADLSLSPVLRWDLYPNDRSVIGSLQTSRGCPFECEFCSVQAYAGRRQRYKPLAHIL